LTIFWGPSWPKPERLSVLSITFAASTNRHPERTPACFATKRVENLPRVFMRLRPAKEMKIERIASALRPVGPAEFLAGFSRERDSQSDQSRMRSCVCRVRAIWNAACLRVSAIDMLRFPSRAGGRYRECDNFRDFASISRYLGNSFDSTTASIEGQFAPS